MRQWGTRQVSSRRQHGQSLSMRSGGSSSGKAWRLACLDFQASLNSISGASSFSFYGLAQCKLETGSGDFRRKVRDQKRLSRGDIVPKDVI